MMRFRVLSALVLLLPRLAFSECNLSAADEGRVNDLTGKIAEMKALMGQVSDAMQRFDSLHPSEFYRATSVDLPTIPGLPANNLTQMARYHLVTSTIKTHAGAQTVSTIQQDPAPAGREIDEQHGLDQQIDEALHFPLFGSPRNPNFETARMSVDHILIARMGELGDASHRAEKEIQGLKTQSQCSTK